MIKLMRKVPAEPAHVEVHRSGFSDTVIIRMHTGFRKWPIFDVYVSRLQECRYGPLVFNYQLQKCVAMLQHMQRTMGAYVYKRGDRYWSSPGDSNEDREATTLRSD